MKPALAILAAALLLAGCGHAVPSHDPFVGTWQSHSPDMTTVIAKVAAGYRVTGEVDSQAASFILSRHGDELRGTFSDVFPSSSIVVAYVPGTGYLTIKSSAGAVTELSKVSASTAWPGPQPVRVATGGPGWTRVLSFSGSAPASAAVRWSAGFKIGGGTVRALGTVTSEDPDNVGLSLALQRLQKASGHWVDVDAQLTPHDQATGPSGYTEVVDWSTDRPLKAGEYRLGMMDGGGVGEKFALTVCVRK